jgi:hypothetical protein
MSEAPAAEVDTFDAEFAAAREAERDDAPAEVEAEAPEVEEEAEEPDLAKAAAEKAATRLADAQKAMKDERRKRQALEKRLEALESKSTKADEKPPTPAELAKLLRDDDDDPIGDIQTVKKLARLLVQGDEQETQASTADRQRAEALATVSSTMKDYEDDFKELHPEYPDAAKHFMDAYASELRDTGLEGNDLTAAMQNNFAGIVARSVAAGKDPAEIIYNMAVRRGFKSETAAAKLETIAKGQEQSRTLPGGGGTSSGQMSMGKIADLKGAAFDAAFDKLRASERRR